ncbi:MAG: hypothetical protein LEGION0403_FIIPPAGN_00416 [Legionella sp.]|uniref:PilW family protein n=1 Tax=Legionella sp. TaxID=459 RepID=UPI003D0D51FD
MRKHAGISLSEVLIGLFLSSLLMTMLMQFYSQSKQGYIEMERMLATNFDLRWVSDLLSDSIRRAGFTPCLGIDQLNLKKQGMLVHGLHIENGPRYLLQINRMHEQFAEVINIPNTRQILVPQASSFNKKRPLIIADCEQAEIQRSFSMRTHAKGVLITLDKPLQFKYTGVVYVGEYWEERWFIKKNAQGKPALFYQLGQPEEVTSLIQSLHSYRQHQNGAVLMQVALGLAEGGTQNIMVTVRGS